MLQEGQHRALDEESLIRELAAELLTLEVAVEGCVMRVWGWGLFFSRRELCLSKTLRSSNFARMVGFQVSGFGV